MKRPDIVIPKGYKAIGFTTLETRQKNGGYTMCANVMSGAPCGATKKYFVALGKSILRYGPFPQLCNFNIVQLETEDFVLGFDSGDPDPLPTKIYVVKDHIKANRQKADDEWDPTIVVDRNGELEYGNRIEILGPCSIIYDDTQKHPMYGDSRIETSAEVKIIL